MCSLTKFPRATPCTTVVQYHGQDQVSHSSPVSMLSWVWIYVWVVLSLVQICVTTSQDTELFSHGVLVLPPYSHSHPIMC